ncbi:MAG: hypothetical protein GX628_03770 [Clostridiales bacterium]|nr:hypothetical protein [Clostridiales bacterium]
MISTRQKFAAILAAVCLLAACSDTGDNLSEGADTEAPTGQFETETETAAPPWYEALDFSGGRITIFSQHEEWEAENDGEIVNDTLFNRKLWLEENLGITIEPIPVHENNVISLVTTTIQVGEDAYDIINAAQYRLAMLTSKGLFREMSDFPYLDFTKECWAQKYMNEMSVAGKTIFMTGDISLKFLHRTSCMYFNSVEYNNLTGSEKDAMYDLVFDGRWTFDTLSGYLKDAYRDLNGDSVVDESDYFGTAVMTGSITEHLAINAGVKYTEKKDGIPVLVVDHTHTVDVIDYIYSLYFENPAVVTYPASLESLDVTMVNKLSAGEMVFMFGWFDTARFLRDMEEDYGVIPYPKYNEAQEEYNALAHDNAGQFCIPVTLGNAKRDMVGALLQAAAEYSAEYLTPAYYEIALKTKYMRDSESVRVLDIIKNAATTDFAYVYNYAIGELGTITRTLMKSQSRDFMSLYTSKESVYKEKLNEVIAAFNL